MTLVPIETACSCSARWRSWRDSAVKWKMAGRSMAATATTSRPALASAAGRLNCCFSRRHPPTTMAPPESSRRLPRMEREEVKGQRSGKECRVQNEECRIEITRTPALSRSTGRGGRGERVLFADGEFADVAFAVAAGFRVAGPDGVGFGVDGQGVGAF